MGFFSSMTGFLGHVATEVTHVIAPDLKFTPSSLLEQAGKLLPSLTDLIPGVGPLVSSGISAVESVISGHDTTSPDPPKTVLPTLDEVKSLIGDTTNAIGEASKKLSAKLDEVDKHLTAKVNKLESATNKLEVDIHDLEINGEIRRDSESRAKTYQILRDKHHKFSDQVSQAIHWWNDHVTELHNFVSYEGNQKIDVYLGESQSSHLVSNRDDLRRTVNDIQNFMRTDDMPPTQDIFDLYVLAVTWLLTYNKMILTLRSFQAQSKFTVNNHKGMSDYFKIQADWNEDLNTAVRDAKEHANFLLGASKQNGFIDDLWQFRASRLSDIVDGESPRDGGYSYFVDSYPGYGIGWTKYDLAFWDIDLQGMVVIQSGPSKQAGEKVSAEEKAKVKKLVEGLRTGYWGLQFAYFQAATRIAREMAHSWRISADRWQSTAPLSPPRDATIVAQAAPRAAGKDDMLKHGLSLDDIARGTGYQKGEEVFYAVSYVTNHGEGKPIGPQDSVDAKWNDGSFFYLKVKAVEFPRDAIEFPKDDSLAGRREARKFDKNITAHIVRRVYATCNDVTRHIIDISAPPHKDVHVWDLGNIAVEAQETVKVKDGEIFPGLVD